MKSSNAKDSRYRPVLERALVHALDYLESLERAPVAASTTVVELRNRLSKPLNEVGLDSVRIIDELVADTADGLLGNAGGRFFGWVMGGSLPAALAADWLTSTWDQNAAINACGPAVGVIEEVCGTWLKELLGLPDTAGFALVTGAQMAHSTCLAAARNALLGRVGWDVERRGMFGAPPIRILSGTERHGSIERAVRLLGFGSNSLVDLPVDDQGQVRAADLSQALRTESAAPTIVALQAGDLSIGAFDPFPELIPIAREHGAWVHIDGAFGLWTATSPTYRHLVRDADLADSWTVDGHKWLNVPYDCGYAFVADGAAHRASMSHRASYLQHADESRDQIDWNPEWSRRARGVATYAAIRQLGRQGIADLIERSCRHASTLANRIGAMKGAELVWAPSINQGLVRFLDQTPNATDANHDRRTDEVIDAILASGEAFFSGTTWRGRRCMRISVVNHQTTDDDIDRTVAAVQALLER